VTNASTFHGVRHEEELDRAVVDGLHALLGKHSVRDGRVDAVGAEILQGSRRLHQGAARDDEVVDEQGGPMTDVAHDREDLDVLALIGALLVGHGHGCLQPPGELAGLRHEPGVRRHDYEIREGLLLDRLAQELPSSTTVNAPSFGWIGSPVEGIGEGHARETTDERVARWYRTNSSFKPSLPLLHPAQGREG
jgi:hypothetical protein